MSRRSARGFTLLELLVAVAITLGLAAAMLAVVDGTMDQWRRTQAKFTTAAQANQVLDLVERDLQGALFRADGATWLAVDVLTAASTLGMHGWLTSSATKPAAAISLRLLPNDENDRGLPVAQARFGVSGAWLRCLTTNVEADGSQPVAVAYQIARRPVSGSVTASNPADLRYTLFRSAVSAPATLTTGLDVAAGGYVSTVATPAAARSPRTLTNPNTADALASNVVDFGLWLYVRDAPAGWRRIFPADANDLTHAARSVGLAADATRFPELADVMVRLLTEEGAELLAAMEASNSQLRRPVEFATDAEWWWGVVEAHSEVHCRRIALRGNLP